MGCLRQEYKMKILGNNWVVRDRAGTRGGDLGGWIWMLIVSSVSKVVMPHNRNGPASTRTAKYKNLRLVYILSLVLRVSFQEITRKDYIS